MEWPEELLEIFKDPLFANVHPASHRQTADDRLKSGFKQICEWSATHNGCAPAMNHQNIKEYQLAMRLKAIIDDDGKRESLREMDTFGLLNMIYDE
jgi:hypothetical protein